MRVTLAAEGGLGSASYASQAQATAPSGPISVKDFGEDFVKDLGRNRRLAGLSLAPNTATPPCATAVKMYNSRITHMHVPGIIHETVSTAVSKIKFVAVSLLHLRPIFLFFHIFDLSVFLQRCIEPPTCRAKTGIRVPAQAALE